MTSRERVRRALAHQEPDRVPIDIGGHSASRLMAVQTLCGIWKLALDPRNDGRAGNWFDKVRPDAVDAPVPGIIQQVFPGYHGVAWYWHSFRITEPTGRDDRMASISFAVIDIQDPAKPVVVSRNNLLGYKEPAADLIVSTYFKEFDPFDFAGCYKGSASYFAMMAGPVPAGHKLFIQSSAFLYCIGEK